MITAVDQEELAIAASAQSTQVDEIEFEMDSKGKERSQFAFL